MPAAALASQGTLLIYENLDLQADFAGMKADAKLTAKLDHGGSVNASITASDLNAAAPRIAGKMTRRCRRSRRSAHSCRRWRISMAR